MGNKLGVTASINDSPQTMGNGTLSSHFQIFFNDKKFPWGIDFFQRNVGIEKREGIACEIAGSMGFRDLLRFCKFQISGDRRVLSLSIRFGAFYGSICIS